MNDSVKRPDNRRRRSRSEALRLAAEFEQSGQSRKAFCQQHGLSPASLDHYRQLGRQNAAKGSSTVADLQLVPVDVLDKPTPQLPFDGDAGLYLVLPHGRRLAIGSGFDAAALTRLLSVLDQG